MEACLHPHATLLTRSAKPRIAAYGLFYAGKSSLLNLLASSVKKEIFSTCEPGEPFVSHTHETEHYVLADAPNLDMLDAQGSTLPASLRGVDIALLVHAPGDLEAEELAWLNTLRHVYGAEASQRLVLVLTHRDKSQGGSAQMQEDKLMAQLQAQFALSPACFSVSNSFYVKGILEARHDLVLASNLLALRQHLRHMALRLQTAALC